MRESRIRRVVNNGGTAVGMQVMEFGTRGIAKILEYADLDYVIIDMEHSAFGLERVADLIAWFKATDIDTIVRVPENLYHYLAGVLDAGASGVQVANIDTAEQARAIVRSVKYAPMGNRGLGLTAAHSDFCTPKAAEYLPFKNAQTIVITQVETAEGLKNCEEIAAVEGVDALAVGANDMTFSLGIHGQFEHPMFIDAMTRVIAACKRHGKMGKCHPHHASQVGEFSKMGYQMMMLNSDVSHLRQAIKASVDNMRRNLEETTAASPRSIAMKSMLVGALCAFLPEPASAAASEFPQKPIRWIVPWPPGGGVDIATRAMSPALSEFFGQNLVVENRPGASGMIGTSIAAKAPPDGYTIITGAAGPNAILPHFNPQVPYGLDDFASIAHLANTVYVLVVHPALPVSSVQQLIALAKSKPGELTIGSAGSGTPAHLAAEFFMSLGGIKLTHVPYKGAAGPAIDVLSGHIAMTIGTISPSLPHIRAGRLKPLGVTSSTRSSHLPKIPTIAESGLSNYEIVNWYGLLAPAGTPVAVIDKINKGVIQVLARPDVRERLTDSGLEIVGSTPEAFRKFREADFENWRRVVKSANIKFKP